MRQEYALLKKNNTPTPVPQSEATSDPIDCKWVYKTESNPNGTLGYKARLAIKGFKQVEGVNFDETYASVGNMSTLRYLLSLVARNEWKWIIWTSSRRFTLGVCSFPMTFPKASTTLILRFQSS